MEFKSLKNIETSFRQIRTMGIMFVSLCALVTGYALWEVPDIGSFPRPFTEPAGGGERTYPAFS